MNHLRVILRSSRCFATVTAAPKTSTGIEHAEAFAKKGGQKPNWNMYKVSDYLNMSKYSFYQAEITMANHRLQQPTNKKPDVMPKVTIDATSKTKSK